MNFLESTGTGCLEMDSVQISQKEYFSGYHIIAFDLSPLKDNRLYLHPPQQGTMSLRIRTSSPLEKNITVFCIASYSKQLQFVEDKVLMVEDL